MTALLLTAAAPEMLQDVERAYAVGEHWARVGKVFDPGSKRRPAKVFRDHKAKHGDYVVEPDISDRLALDLLLGGLSALHAGGLSADPAPIKEQPGRRRLASFLSEPVIRAWYEDHYPYAPPILVRLAAEGGLPEDYRRAWASEVRDERFGPLYRQFLHLDARFIADETIGSFISLLDDFFVDGEHIEDLGWALEKPKRLKKWLEEDEDRWGLLEAMEAFLEFSLDLDALLQRTDLPILAGHVWLHFAYWFGSGGERMLELAHWLAKAARKVEGSEIDETAASVIVALERLRTPQPYAVPVLEAAGDALKPWLRSSGVGKRWMAPQASAAD